MLTFSPLNSAGLPVDLARIDLITRGAMHLTVQSDAKMRIAENGVAAQFEIPSPRSGRGHPLEHAKGD